jgi:hypothetical protein
MHPTQPRPLSLALLSIMVLPALAGCPEQACTLLYAPDHVVVEFQADAFDAGEWQVDVGGQSCTITLPGTDADIVCTSDAEALYLTLNSAGTAITEAMLTEAAPASLVVEVSRDGAVVASETLSPVYEEFEPNGEGCGVSQAGAASLDLDG